MNPPPSLRVVIPSRGMEPLLHACLDALRRALEACAGLVRPEPHIVVVDHASCPPYLPERFPSDTHLVRLDADHGFAGAVNRAARRHPATRLLLLNNDVLLHPDALPPLLHEMHRDARIGIVGTRLVFPDGRLQHAGVECGALPDGGPGHPGRGLPADVASPAPTAPQAVTGACMLIRGETFESLHGLDESYDCGGEDVDFCLRARQAGWRVTCLAGPASVHFESMTPGRVERDVASRRLGVARWKERCCRERNTS